MNSVNYKYFEFLVIFIIAPISFVFKYPVWIKLAIGIVGFLYVIYVLLKVEKEMFMVSPNLNWRLFWKETLLKLILIMSLTTLFVFLTSKDFLFNVLLNKPIFWLLIIFIYSLFSVYPQELIYRTFYFKRYRNLINDKWLFIIINAVVFSLGHLFFKNYLVILLTFIGGLLFALTFTKTKSTLLVSIEHAIYGSWLFTVGMGTMLGFPA